MNGTHKYHMKPKQTLLPSDIAALFEKARELRAEGQLLEAERIYRGLATQRKYRSFALEALVGPVFVSAATG